MTSFRLKKSNLQNRTLKELTDEYILYLQANQRTTWTLKSYREKFSKLLSFVGEDILLKDVNSDIIERYKKHLLTTNRETSVNTHLIHIKALFNYGKEKGYMSNIIIKKLEANEKIKRIYSKEDLAELLREEPNESFMQYQCRIIIATFVGTGLRLSELTSLQIRDVDFSNLVIYSRHTKSKKPRLLPISSSLKVLLLEWFNNRKYSNQEDGLFCNSYGESLKVPTLRTLMNRYIAKKGVKDKSIHQFRRTFITNAVNNGVDIITLSRITGHSNLKMLNKYYVNCAETVVNVADKCSVLEQLNVVPKVRKHIDSKGGRR